MLLEVKSIEVHYQKVAALKGISLKVEGSEIVTLIGANGAGKSTTLRTITGLKRPSSGEIWFEGERIDRLGPHKIVQRGIAHVLRDAPTPSGRRGVRERRPPARGLRVFAPKGGGIC